MVFSRPFISLHKRLKHMSSYKISNCVEPVQYGQISFSLTFINSCKKLSRLQPTLDHMLCETFNKKASFILLFKKYVITSDRLKYLKKMSLGSGKLTLTKKNYNDGMFSNFRDIVKKTWNVIKSSIRLKQSKNKSKFDSIFYNNHTITISQDISDTFYSCFSSKVTEISSSFPNVHL